MKIVANLGVLDEVELIAKCINHLRSIGVDHIVVTDAGSTDGTVELLQTFSADPDICLIELTGEGDVWGFPERMYERTVKEFSPDYILSIDADEFWLPKWGDLKKTIGLGQFDVIKAPRFHVPLLEDQPVLPERLSPDFYDRLYLITNPVQQPDLQVHRDHMPSSTMGFPSAPDEGALGRTAKQKSSKRLHFMDVLTSPKVMLMPNKVAGFGMGGHAALPLDGGKPTERVCDDLIIAHVRLSTYDRFARKLGNIEKSLSQFGHHLKGGQAVGWRVMLEVAKAGEAQDEFQRQLLSQEQFNAAVASRTIETASQWFDRQTAD